MQKKQLEAVKDKYPDLVIKGTVQEGRAATVLKDTSKDADLIVIGHRGRGGARAD
jgi:nucleotide-binding universal stress UspA family protein